MNFDYSDDQKLLQQSIKGLLKDKFSTEFVREFTESNKISQELHGTLAEQGLLTVIEEDDLDSGLIYSVLISYEAGRRLLPFPVLESHVISYCLSKYAKNDKVNEELLSAEKLFTLAWKKEFYEFTEDNKFTGHFKFVPFANSSDYMVVNITLPEEDKVKLLLIDLNDECVEIITTQSMDQTYPLNEVKLTNYELTDNTILYTGSSDSRLDADIQNVASLLISAEAIGAGEEMLETTVDYTKERIQFNQPIAKFQAVKHKASQMYLLLESSRATLKYATWAMSKGIQSEIDQAIPILKSHVSESTNELIGEAIQLHGGIGFSWESDVHMYYKRARRISGMHGNIYEHRKAVFENLLQKV